MADPSLLNWYREDAAGPTRTVFVDVPTADLEEYRVSNSEEQIGQAGQELLPRPRERILSPAALTKTRERLPDRFPSPGDIAGDDRPRSPGHQPERGRGRGA